MQGLIIDVLASHIGQHQRYNTAEDEKRARDDQRQGDIAPAEL